MQSVCVLVFFLFCCLNGFSQRNISTPNHIAPYHIAVSYHQTTNLIFPYAIKSVDRGSASMMAQKAKGVENILQLKAAKEHFTPTNVSVVTADGRFYSFLLHYADQPSPLNINFAGGAPVRLSGEPANAWQLERASFQVLGQRRFMRLQYGQQALRLRLLGIFHSEHTLWLKLRLENNSQVDFQPVQVRFFLRDKKRTKRTALHETELEPVYMPVGKNITGLTASDWTIGFQPFTVPRHQRLVIQLSDDSGGRTLQMRVKSGWFLKARKLPL